MRTDEPYRTFELERLGERIAALEDDRSALMAAIQHMRRGRLDGSYLTDPLRAELARSPSYGVLLETLEVELRCLRRCLTERAGNAVNDDTLRALRRWQEIDRRLRLGEFDPEALAAAVIEAGLARRASGPGLPRALEEVWVIEPDRGENLVPGPVLLIGFQNAAYGGRRLYRPISDELRWDTGLFS